MDNLVNALADQLAMLEQLQLLVRYMLFLCIAIALFSGLLLVYLFYLTHRLTKLEKEVSDLQAILQSKLR
jgi:hypothetical protein